MGVLLGRVGVDGQRERVRAVGRSPWEATKFPKAGVWTPLPMRAPPEARSTQKPTPKVGSFGKRWAKVVIMNDPEGRGPFRTPPENRAPGSPDPGATHISQPMSPLHSWGPDVYRARGQRVPNRALLAPRPRRRKPASRARGALEPSKLRAAPAGCSARLCPTGTSTAPRSAPPARQSVRPWARRRRRRATRPAHPPEPKLPASQAGLTLFGFQQGGGL